MAKFLYLQYVIIRPLGVAPDTEAWDNKSKFLMMKIMDDEREANFLADKKNSFDRFGYMDYFIVRVPYTSKGWYPPRHISIEGDRVFNGGMYYGDWFDKELEKNTNNIYCFDGKLE